MGVVAVLLVAPTALAGRRAPAGSASGEMGVSLTPMAGTKAPLGDPIPFKVSVHNPSSDEAMANVMLRVVNLMHPRNGINFEDWMVMVPPEGTVEEEFKVTTATWFAATGVYQIQAKMHRRLMAVLDFDVELSMVQVPGFRDVAQSVGITTDLEMPMCLARFVSGAAWGDATGGGALDLYVPAQDAPAQLWVNDGRGHFTDQAAMRGVDNGGRVGLGAVFADVNNDGAEDLYVVNDGPNRLYLNDGTGHFSDVAPKAGVDYGGNSTSASWGDFDADGNIDLYVTNYVHCTDGTGSVLDKLYRNNGDGKFTDVTSLLGPPEVTAGAGFQAAWLDYNGDGRLDLYLANDHLGKTPPGNHLWRNDGPGKDGEWQFTDVSHESGTDYVFEDMGIGVGDSNNDGRMDLALSDMGPNALAINNGDGTFTDMAAEARVDRPMQKAMAMSVTWGLGFGDVNLDGWNDLYLGAGAMPMMMDGPDGMGMDMSYQPNELFVNETDGHYADLSAPSGTNNLAMARGLAFADYDRDGRLDMFVVNQEAPSNLYRNTTPRNGNHWLEVRTRGTVSNRDGCGALIVATMGTMNLTREVFCGSVGLGSGSDRTVHFGLGPYPDVSQLEIDWPSGIHQVLMNVGADRLITVKEQR